MHQAPPVTDAPRWAQLTYASFDPGNGAGGWQVKEVRGDLTPSEQREISPHLVTSFDAHVPMPEYPTPADVAAQPRRCSYLVAHDGPIGVGTGPWHAVTRGCLLHAVQAGSDSTGRPGNVFTHAVLDRRPREGAPPIRPIELWRSFDLLTPYGARDVLAATLRPGEYPEPSGLVGRDLVLSFVFDPSTWRMGVLSVLLDAVDAAMRGGPRVVLVTTGPDQAAMWFGAVSWLMSPGTARALSWSVYERGARLRQAFERGEHLVAVPRADARALSSEDRWYVVIDDESFPSLGEVGAAPHRTSAGHTISATPWSHLVQEALVDEATATRVLERADALASEAGDWGLAPAWPLAMARLDTAADGDDTAVARRTAIAQAPAVLADGADIDRLLRGAIASTLGETADDAWRALGDLDDRQPGARLAREEYLVRAFADDAWLTATAPPPLPTVHSAAPAGPRVRAAADEALARARDDDDPVRVLRVCDLAARAGRLDGDDGARARAAAVEAVRDVVAPLLLERPAPGPRASGTALAAAGLLDPRIHRDLVPTALRQAGPGERLDPSAATWLVQRGLARTPSATGAWRRPAGDPDDLDLALAVAFVRAQPTAFGAGYAAMEALLATYGSWYAIPEHMRVVTRASLWRADELDDLEQRFPGALPPEFLEATLACDAPSAALGRLARRVAERHGTMVGAIARARWQGTDPATDDSPNTDPAATLRAAEYLRTTEWAEHVRIDAFAPIVLEAAIREAAVAPTSRSQPDELLRVVEASADVAGASTRAAQRVVAGIYALPSNEALRASGSLAALAAATVDGSVAFEPPPLARVLATLAADQGGRLLDEIPRTLAGGDPEALRTLAHEAARQLAGPEASAGSRPRVEDRRIAELERLVAQCLHGVDAPEQRRAGARPRTFRTRTPKEP